IAGEIVMRNEIKGRRAISGCVGDGKHACIICLQEPVILKAISCQRVIGERHGERQVSFVFMPTELPESLPHIRRRKCPPTVFGKRIAGKEPIEPVTLGAAHSASTCFRPLLPYKICPAHPGFVSPLLVVTEIEPPSVLRPNTGSDPEINAI